IERHRTPVGILMPEEAERIEATGPRLVALWHWQSELETRRRSWMNDFPAGRLHWSVLLLERFNLCRGQAARSVSALAQKRGGIEDARIWLAYDPVLHPILRVARGHHRVRNQGFFLRRDHLRAVLDHRHLTEDAGGMEVVHVVARVADNDAVEVVGIALRLHHALAAAGRTAVPVRQPRATAVDR